MLKEIFNCDKTPSGRQANFLRVMSIMPDLKSQLGGTVNKDDIQVSKDAKEVMNKHNIPLHTCDQSVKTKGRK